MSEPVNEDLIRRMYLAKDLKDFYIRDEGLIWYLAKGIMWSRLDPSVT